jgi:hypothetical protein
MMECIPFAVNCAFKEDRSDDAIRGDCCPHCHSWLVEVGGHDLIWVAIRPVCAVVSVHHAVKFEGSLIRPDDPIDEVGLVCMLAG